MATEGEPTIAVTAAEALEDVAEVPQTKLLMQLQDALDLKFSLAEGNTFEQDSDILDRALNAIPQLVNKGFINSDQGDLDEVKKHTTAIRAIEAKLQKDHGKRYAKGT